MRDIVVQRLAVRINEEKVFALNHIHTDIRMLFRLRNNTGSLLVLRTLYNNAYSRIVYFVC